MDFKLFGRWLDYTQFTAMGDKEPLLVAGVAADYTEAGITRQFSHVADVQFDLPNSLSFYAAYLGRYTTSNAGAPGTNGGTRRPAFSPTPTIPPFGAGRLSDRESLRAICQVRVPPLQQHRIAQGIGHDTIQDMTLGFNYYLVGHRAKFSAAASYLPNGSPIANTQSDLLTNRHNEILIQAQFQLMI